MIFVFSLKMAVIAETCCWGLITKKKVVCKLNSCLSSLLVSLKHNGDALAYKVIFYRCAFFGLLHKFRCPENFYLKPHQNKGVHIAEHNIPCTKLSVIYYWNTHARNTDNVKMVYVIGQCTVFVWCIHNYILYSKSHVTFMFSGFMFQKVYLF